MENKKNPDKEFDIFKKAILEFAGKVENDIQLQIYIKESRKYIEFLINYYLGLGKLNLVRERINDLDLTLLIEIEKIGKKLELSINPQEF
ncbi:MAG: hypothetical protein LBQ84_08360 [Flavobacteriaceae bacterium]|jgi:hypothetical protein|nr:hypothetical protein [Flavobacteriaceae bacterium]